MTTAMMLMAQACTSPPGPRTVEPVAAEVSTVLAEDLVWTQLNPARGDQSPKAAALWGDRTTTGAAGFLVGFVDGFSSPPHIHNVSYRGVVIDGQIHNDDPSAASMWMESGSYWTQPAGASHITSARGSNALTYIEIEQGPYLVRPPKDAFPIEERPINVDASNLVWQPTPEASRGEMALLWGAPLTGQPGGYLVRLPGEATGGIGRTGTRVQVVVIAGRPFVHEGERQVTLAPASYLQVTGRSSLGCEAGSDCVVYVRTEAP